MPGVSPNAGAAARPTANTIELVVAGAAGRMGTRIVACLVGNPDLRLVGALEAPAHPTLGRDAGELAGGGRLGVAVSGDPAAVLTPNRVLVEVSVPEASLEHLRLVARIGARAVIGTTGFTPGQPPGDPDPAQETGRPPPARDLGARERAVRPLSPLDQGLGGRHPVAIL